MAFLICQRVSHRATAILIVFGAGEYPINRHSWLGNGRAGADGSRAFKDALIYAAEHSKDSADGTLESYLLDLADNHKALFVPLLGRLLPLQVNARTQAVTKITYRTVEEVKSALIARGLSEEKCDLLLLGKVPQPIQPVEVLGDVE